MEERQTAVPPAALAFIGGSSTFSIRFPEDLQAADVEVHERRLVFDTPYGQSPIFKLFAVGSGSRRKRVLTVKMHGRRLGVSRADSSRQVFWVLREAGVRRIVAEGGVGAVNHLLELKDLLVPSDYIDQSLRRDVELGGPHLLVMRNPVCDDLRQKLLAVARGWCQARRDERRLFGRGIYAVTDGRHWESRAEVQALRQMGADVVGQSMCPEVYLSREIGACFAGLYLVVNYAEGVIRDWSHAELQDFFYGEARAVGEMILETLRRIDAADQSCGCPDLKKPTLLVDTEYAE